MEEADIDEILTMGKKTFKEKYLITSCGWRGKTVLQRNAMIRKVYFEKGSLKEFKFNAEQLIKLKEKLDQI